MPRLLNKPWFVACLGLTAVVLTGRALLPTGPSLPAPQELIGIEAVDGESESIETPATPVSAEVIAAALRTLEPVAVALRDPFTPTAAGVKAAAGSEIRETVQVSAVWLQGSSAFGVLNGRVCAPGDTVGAVTIDRITIDGVWLTHRQGRDFVAVGSELSVLTSAPGADASLSLSAVHEG